jgi:hypothetical protein
VLQSIASPKIRRNVEPATQNIGGLIPLGPVTEIVAKAA